MTGNLFYVFVTLLVMINPIEAAAAFATMTENDDARKRADVARRATVAATIILLAFGFVGDRLLTALGISFAAFRVAGGLLLMKVGFGMVFDPAAGDSASATPRAPQPDPAVFPLAVPIITGPGALAAIVTLMTKTHESMLRVIALVLVALLVMAITYAAMRASLRMTRWFGPSGIDAIGRVVGIVVTAIAIQIVVDGLAQLAPGVFRTGARQ